MLSSSGFGCQVERRCLAEDGCVFEYDLQGGQAVSSDIAVNGQFTHRRALNIWTLHHPGKMYRFRLFENGDIAHKAIQRSQHGPFTASQTPVA